MTSRERDQREMAHPPLPPRRSHASAKAAGTRFERAVADYLATHVSEFIDRRVKTGATDKGDIVNVRTHGQRVVLECKDVTRLSLGQWITEADTERGNDDALVGAVIHKRRGTTDPGDQYVTCTLRDLVALLTGTRP
ncbi:MAG TPA: hypothetical protein VJL80_09930 [Aeromicrobium sp.]|nr:hypothetical protein [Aeromicrobium sp.]HKY58345.1 hypothetical protein [Aeromicrobium sp.]